MFKIFRHLKPYIGWLLAAVALIIGQVFAELALPDYMSDIINNGLTYEVNAAGELVQVANIGYILEKGGMMLLLSLAASAAAILICFISSKISMGFGRKVRSSLFQKVETFSLKEVDKFGTASLITRNTNDVTQMQNFIVMAIRILAMAPFMFGIALYKMISKSTATAPVLYMSIPLILITIFVIGLLVSPLFKKMQKKVDHLTMVTRENLTGVRVIRAFNKQESQTKKFAKANKEVTQISLKASRMMSIMMPAIQFIMNLSMVGIVFLAAKGIENGDGNVGAMMASMTYIMNIMMSLIMVTMVFVQIPRASASAQRINEVLDTEPDIGSPAQPVLPEERRGLVEFRNVDFSYTDSSSPDFEKVLSDINFTARPGETTAIIGSTGSGKSTILNLIPRFYDASAGQILVDGTDVREMDPAELRTRIGFVPQKALLFTGTIRDNMKYGKADATDEEIMNACEIAQATEFIENTEARLDTEVAQGGNNFSGGQKQRLSIARALVKRPEIYVFDDSFSALDFKTEAKLQQALRREVGDATVIIVGQRISSIMNADNILVIDEGKIVAQGKHRELLENSDVYREIAESQLSEEELA